MAGKGTVTIKYLGDVNDLQRSMKKAGTATSSFSSKLKKAALALGGLYVAKQAARWLIDCAKAADADRISQATLAKVLQNTTGATDDQIKSMEKWIRTQQFALGISDEAIREGFAPILAVTGDITKAQELMIDSMDLAIGRNMELKTAAELLAKGYSGNLGLFSRYGISIKDAEGKTKSFAEILDDLRKAYGGAAKAAADASPWGQLAEIWSEAKEVLGNALLPKLSQLAQWFVNNPDALIKAVEKIAKVFIKLGEGIMIAVNAMNNFMSVFENPTGAGDLDYYNYVKGLNARGANIPLPDMSAWDASRVIAPTAPFSENIFRAEGGPIPGAADQAVPVIAHGGEFVLNKKDASNLSGIMATVASEVRMLREEVRTQNQRIAMLSKTGYRPAFRGAV